MALRILSVQCNGTGKSSVVRTIGPSYSKAQPSASHWQLADVLENRSGELGCSRSGVKENLAT